VGVSPQNFFQGTCREAGVIKWVLLLEGLPPKIWEGEKNVQNSERFLTTFDFDREYFRNASAYCKQEMYFINQSPSHVWRKKLRELWSTSKKVIVPHIDQLKLTFCARLHFGLWGVLSPQIFYTRYRLTKTC